MRLALRQLLLLVPVALSALAAAPANRDLGVLIDPSSAAGNHDGVRILGATPGGIGDRAGLRPGDVITRVNGVALSNLGSDPSGRSLATRTLRTVMAQAPASAPLRLTLLRDGATLTLNIAAAPGASDTTSVRDVANSACGRISTFDVAPRSQHLFHAKILLIDGVTPGPGDASSFRVAAGVHQLLVAEDIPTTQMGVGSIASLRSRRDTSKHLEVEVAANSTLMVAARLNVEHASRFTDAAYWDPVAWRVVREACP